MHPLLGKTLLRVGLFYTYGLFFAWIFTLIEKRDESSHDRMENKLRQLRKKADFKYNMTDEDFKSFTKEAAETIMQHRELDWTFVNSCAFVFAALTTIGFGNITPTTELGQGVTIIFCLLGIPITMLAIKTAAELWASCIRFLVIKTETCLLKRAEPKHVKVKTFLVAFSLIVVLLILSSVSTIYIEKWSFIESLYTWFVTFTTIGFGDFVQLETLQRKVDHGETSQARLVFYGILFELPYLVGLSLMYCILTCLVESMDQICDFRDRCMKGCSSLISLLRRLLCRQRSSYDLKREDNLAL